LGFTELTVFAILALPPVAGWLFFWRKRLAEPEPAHVLAQLFLFGIFAALSLFILREYDFFSWAAPLVLLIFFAFLEESLKGLLLIGGVELNKSHFDKWEDGFEFAVLIALGFAFAENIFYFFREFSAGGLSLDFWNLYLFRSLGTILAHTIFTGSFGYFYACAFVAKKIVPKSKHEKPLAHFFRNLAKVLRRPFHITLCHLLPQKDSAHGHTSGEVVLEGLFLAIFLHAIFNAFLFFNPLEKSLAFLTVPILIGGGWWYAVRFKTKQLPSKKV